MYVRARGLSIVFAQVSFLLRNPCIGEVSNDSGKNIIGLGSLRIGDVSVVAAIKLPAAGGVLTKFLYYTLNIETMEDNSYNNYMQRREEVKNKEN